jgi:dihydroorotate dehydrogenase
VVLLVYLVREVRFFLRLNLNVNIVVVEVVASVLFVSSGAGSFSRALETEKSVLRPGAWNKKRLRLRLLSKAGAEKVRSSRHTKWTSMLNSCGFESAAAIAALATAKSHSENIFLENLGKYPKRAAERRWFKHLRRMQRAKRPKHTRYEAWSRYHVVTMCCF